MLTDAHNAVVVGAGLAGLCCAGELVSKGQRPLLICETKEVGAVFPVRTLGEGNRAFLQHVTWQTGWGGGWWFGLARRLNLPLRLHNGLDWEISLAGTGQTVRLPICATARTMTDTLASAFPLADRDGLERVLERALAIPFDELVEMHDVRLDDWLVANGADEQASVLILALAGMANDLRIPRAREHLSVFGGLGVLRMLLCGEGTLPIVYPNIREGLCIPLADAIESGGGEVRRQAKVSKIVIEGGAVRGIDFADGSHLEVSTVAIAAGNPRIAEILDPVPDAVQAPLDYLAGVDMQDFNQFYLLRHPVAPERVCNVVFDPESMAMLQGTLSMTGVAPWTTEPGKQLLLGHAAFTPDEVERLGGTEGVFRTMTERADQQFPGLADALIEVKNVSNRHHWFAPLCVGPKLPRTLDEIEGLYFVGDGSRPCAGVWTEAAASCGILGARDMLRDLAVR